MAAFIAAILVFYVKGKGSKKYSAKQEGHEGLAVPYCRAELHLPASTFGAGNVAAGIIQGEAAYI